MSSDKGTPNKITNGFNRMAIEDPDKTGDEGMDLNTKRFSLVYVSSYLSVVDIHWIFVEGGIFFEIQAYRLPEKK